MSCASLKRGGTIITFTGRNGVLRTFRNLTPFHVTLWLDNTPLTRLDGCSELRIIFRHMLPSFLSHIIAAVTLAIPGVILAETALSFLGLGLRPPVVSWGVLLQEAQNIRSVATAPWLLIPGLGVVVAVLTLNFLGDGLRDAADPYGH